MFELPAQVQGLTSWARAAIAPSPKGSSSDASNGSILISGKGSILVSGVVGVAGEPLTAWRQVC
ncbi:hypothetical protein PF011_g32380 [Phytophthora fragariae]|uniref:Uncharacterized protein n=1 Tax=Phytophthora fragariae TaxID=53985 RepID=A0A6A3G9D4_9STRA|nr:hypothetical protein PF011_g32380 [Phytophthora fragariae]